MVGPGEVDAELEGETANECEKYGPVDKVAIKEIRTLPPDESVRIFVKFARRDAASRG